MISDFFIRLNGIFWNYSLSYSWHYLFSGAGVHNWLEITGEVGILYAGPSWKKGTIFTRPVRADPR
jgi:hypothetical protein